LVGRALAGKRDQVVIASKFGNISHPGGGIRAIDGSPANLRVAVEGSLRRLGTDYIDLYYQHRMDPKTPIEDTVVVFAELIAAGNDAALVDRVLRMVDLAEYKRRQSAPGTKISGKAFGRDRRLPITNRFREGV